MKKTISCLGFYLFMAPAIAQLPTNYITKVSYLEQTFVSFEMIGDSDEVIVQSVQSGEGYPASPYGKGCLTLAELSRYHGYRQDISMTQYIDLEGDLLTDKRITYEENVRDDWMPAYSRIVLGKELYQIYGANDSLLYNFSREELADWTNPVDSLYLSAQAAANFQHYVLDDNFYQRTIQEFQNLPIPPDSLFIGDGLLVAQFDSMTILYDHQFKLSVLTEYDWYRVNKKKETVILYGFTENLSGYAPLQEFTTEWFLSQKGCCIRKSTVILREQFRRVVNEEFTQYITPFVPGQVSYGKKSEDHYTISSIPGSNTFMVQNEQHRGEDFHIAVYDLAGRLLIRKIITEGTPVMFPSSSAGLYLIELLDKDGKGKIVRQVIKPESGNSF